MDSAYSSRAFSNIRLPVITLAGVLIFFSTQLMAQASNLALNKPTFQNCTYGKGVSSKAVDGNSDGNWKKGSVTHTCVPKKPQRAQWCVDLGQVYRLDRVQLFGRTDCCTERFDHLAITTSENNKPPALSALKGNEFTLRPANRKSHTQAMQGKKARWVCVNKAGTRDKHSLSLAEVKVFATTDKTADHRESKTTPKTSAKKLPFGTIPCAKEDKSCTLPGENPLWVYYGAKDKWIGKLLKGSVPCNNTTFSDPLPNTSKSCRYLPEAKAKTGKVSIGYVDFNFEFTDEFLHEHLPLVEEPHLRISSSPQGVLCKPKQGSCDALEGSWVYVGQGKKWLALKQKGKFKCDSLLGSTRLGSKQNECYISGFESLAPAGKRCAKEGETCGPAKDFNHNNPASVAQFATGYTVYYGAGDRWVRRVRPAGSSTPCTNAFFGDPAPGKQKSCHHTVWKTTENHWTRAQFDFHRKQSKKGVPCHRNKKGNVICKILGPATVYYGEGNSWIASEHNFNGKLPCIGSNFPFDPAFGKAKTCYVDQPDIINLEKPADFAIPEHELKTFIKWSVAEMARQDAPACWKVARSPTRNKCASGSYFDGATTCWTDCDYAGVHDTDCAAMCTKSTSSCFTETANMVVSSVSLLGNVVGAGVAVKGIKNSAKAVNKTNDVSKRAQMVQDIVRVGNKVAAKAQTRLHKQLSNWVSKTQSQYKRAKKTYDQTEAYRKQVEFEAYVSRRIAQELVYGELNQDPDAREVLKEITSGLSIVDPTGITDVMDAFNKPLCEATPLNFQQQGQLD